MSASSKSPFNSPLEAGIRTVVILDAFAPAAFDLATLSLLDYYVVHAVDAGADESLHPDLETRAGEYLIRRRLVEEGAALMVRSFLVDKVHDKDGISFRSCEISSAMISLMNTAYNRKLKKSARWLADKAQKDGLQNFLGSLKAGIDRWTVETVGEYQQ